MKKPSLPKPITILILTLLTSVMWVGFTIYRAFSLKPPQTVPENISNPITPTLNTGAIQKIESAVYLNDYEIPQIEVGALKNNPILPIPETPQPSPSSTPIASPSSTPQVQI